MHLPSIQTLANIANAKYGITQINVFTNYTSEIPPNGKICGVDISTDDFTSVNMLGSYWSNSELEDDYYAYLRNIFDDYTSWYRAPKWDDKGKALCVGD